MDVNWTHLMWGYHAIPWDFFSQRATKGTPWLLLFLCYASLWLELRRILIYQFFTSYFSCNQYCLFLKTWNNKFLLLMDIPRFLNSERPYLLSVEDPQVATFCFWSVLWHSLDSLFAQYIWKLICLTKLLILGTRQWHWEELLQLFQGHLLCLYYFSIALFSWEIVHMCAI